MKTLHPSHEFGYYGQCELCETPERSQGASEPCPEANVADCPHGIYGECTLCGACGEPSNTELCNDCYVNGPKVR